MITNNPLKEGMKLAQFRFLVDTLQEWGMRDTQKWADKADYRRRDPGEDHDTLGKREKDFEGNRLAGTE